MRFSLAAVALAAAPALVSAAGTAGFALGTKKADGSCKYQADYEADFDAISAATDAKVVRGYSASDCNNAQYVLPAAKAKGFQVILGMWPDTDESYNADFGALKQYVPGNEDAVYAITCGSETLYRGNFTGDSLMAKIQPVKDAFPDIKVGTADSWNKFADGTADALVKGGVDILLVNAFAFWQGQDINNATATYFDDLMQAFDHVQKLSGSTEKPELWNGENGWPTDGGSNYGAAIAGTQNAATYYQKGFCAALQWGINAFYFEAFDEPWKPASIGDDGKSAVETVWGAMTADRQSKFDLKCANV